MLLALMALFLSSCSRCGEPSHPQINAEKFKGKTLNILCWEGYADEKFTKGFEQQYNVKVKGTYFATSEELVVHLQVDTVGYDIVTPSPDMAQKLVETGLVQPIDLSKVYEYNNLAEPLRSMRDVVKGGDTYGVPFTYGPDYLVYNADVLKEVPHSWLVLCDPRYKGKVALWDDVSTIYLIAILLGYDDNDNQAIYNLKEEQLANIKRKFADFRRNQPIYWTSAQELNALMRNNKVVVAVGWPLTPSQLRKEGINIKGVIPEEGATGWIDRLMIPTAAPNKELAELWIDYITRPQNMAKVAATVGYSVAHHGASSYLTAEELELTQMDNADYYFKNLNWWHYVKDRKHYNEVWNDMKKGL